jgi:pyrophosphate--fructose-6-phosphate 1-phosphotransferase
MKDKLRVGVLLSGGPAPGGHHVIATLFDLLEDFGELYGIERGAEGLIEGAVRLLKREEVDQYRTKGGFDLLKTRRKKILPTDLGAIKKTIERFRFDALLFIGGDDTATNAYKLSKEVTTSIIHVPKTIDYDLAVPSFGFDTACGLLSQLIKNLKVDARSTGKYYHVLKLMGRDTSHITLECAIRSRANFALITEELLEKETTLDQVVDQILDLFKKRGKDYGVILIPEGISLALKELEEDTELDPHGNVDLSGMESHIKLMQLVQKKAEKIGIKLPPLRFANMGYEARCQDPSEFDLNYTKKLAIRAFQALLEKKSGVMVAEDGAHSIEEYMIQDPKRGHVVKKIPVDLKGAKFRMYHQMKEALVHED